MGRSVDTNFTLKRSQRLILKVSHFLPRLNRTRDLYRYCKVLTVRQLFILPVTLLKHYKLSFDHSYNDKRRKHTVYSFKTFQTKFAGKFFCFLGNFLYNKYNNILALYPLTKQECRNKIINWQLSLDYQPTEDLLSTQGY